MGKFEAFAGRTRLEVPVVLGSRHWYYLKVRMDAPMIGRGGRQQPC